MKYNHFKLLGRELIFYDKKDEVIDRIYLTDETIEDMVCRTYGFEKE